MKSQKQCCCEKKDTEMISILNEVTKHSLLNRWMLHWSRLSIRDRSQYSIIRTNDIIGMFVRSFSKFSAHTV